MSVTTSHPGDVVETPPAPPALSDAITEEEHAQQQATLQQEVLERLLMPEVEMSTSPL
jgi:hypothetical protein